MSQGVHVEPSRRLLFVDVLIPVGQSISGAQDLRGYELKGIILPSVWTTANVTFQAARRVDQVPSTPGGAVATAEFLDVYGDDGNIVQVATSGSTRYVVLGAYTGTAQRGVLAFLEGADLIKVRSGTPAAPVNQAADRQVTLILGASAK